MRKVLLIIAGIGLISSIVLPNIRFINHGSKSYHQLYVVGDSLSDTGTLVGATSQLLGRQFVLDPPFYQNRSFSNGQVAVEILAEQLNLTLKPGWNFNFLNQEYYQIGNNYATAGAQASEMDASQVQGVVLNNFTINKQVAALVKQNKIQSNDLIFFEIGSNDLIFQVLERSLNNKQQIDIISKAIQDQKQALQKLINHGSRHILAMNSPNLGKTPSYTNTSKAEIAAWRTEVYNTLWLNMISNLQKQYPGYIKVFDIFHNFSNLLTAFANQGGNIDQAAVSYSLDPQTFLNGKISPKFNFQEKEKTIDDYFFFDFIHPTKTVHATVGQMLYQAAINW